MPGFIETVRFLLKKGVPQPKGRFLIATWAWPRNFSGACIALVFFSISNREICSLICP